MSAVDVVAISALVGVGLFAYAMLRADRRDEARKLESVRRRLRSRAREARGHGDTSPR